MHSADVRICQSDTMGNIPRLHERQDVIPTHGITEHHDLIGTKAIHPEGRVSKVVTEKHILFKDMQILDQIVR